MDIFKVIGIGISAAVLSVLLKKHRAELAHLLSLLAAAVMFSVCIPYISEIVGLFGDIAERIGTDKKYITVVMKAIGIAYVTRLGEELCRDAGEGAIASGIELAGKVFIMSMSMPVIYSLLETAEKIIRPG